MRSAVNLILFICTKPHRKFLRNKWSTWQTNTSYTTDDSERFTVGRQSEYWYTMTEPLPAPLINNNVSRKWIRCKVCDGMYIYTYKSLKTGQSSYLRSPLSFTSHRSKRSFFSSPSVDILAPLVLKLQTDLLIILHTYSAVWSTSHYLH